ncbi:hypothetical protein SARC_16145 [Sphaeroforma arctica JP610]|uniref:Cullin-like alpha+beta domain-containing protein n=1 Tax=Sphaeroforma arctica JP610 TaxID=667725 RepID=A0A0L0F3Y7_9EUKA|nr:hypothetical protein SARC_16145 [Sphaeroforma arctica JP610]KNC71319.1 hypothetical protein SARC_16145 [Sphaeroforma arctica JP610]|eukprot:XP_014145221.1 hypothetical protein SARC_16145 [Sphaeroforma arctica JP610]
MQDVLEPFKTNYCTKNKGRILTWLPIMGQCIMRANFKQVRISMFKRVSGVLHV